MNQKRMSLMLKSVTIIIGLMGTVFFLILLPALANDLRNGYKEATYLYWPGLLYGWLIGVIVYAALYNFWKICCEIGKDNSFSKENIKYLNNIGLLAIIAATVWFTGLVVLISINVISIAFFVLMVVGIIASVAIAIITIVLAHLVDKAYELKSENELTI